MTLADLPRQMLGRLADFGYDTADYDDVADLGRYLLSANELGLEDETFERGLDFDDLVTDYLAAIA